METLVAPVERTAESIREVAAAFKADNPKAYARNVAAAIGVSEGALLASRIGQADQNVFRLRPEFKELLLELESLGPLMALTRNDNCVHEKTGVYDKPDMKLPHKMGLFLDDPIDLRLFFRAWETAFFVEDGERISIQIFDQAGTAVHKIYASKETNREAMVALAQRFKSDDQSPEQAVAAIEPKPEAELSDETVEAFIAGWRELKDTHDFFPLLHKHGVSRRQAVHIGPADLARKVDNKVHRTILEHASKTGLEIMVFVGNRGCIQIHTGPVEKLLERGPWFNVIDPGFNLHLKEEGIVETYVVTKPTEDGDVTALELFNADGELIVQFFGKRKPGIPELPEWRELMAKL